MCFFLKNFYGTILGQHLKQIEKLKLLVVILS